MRRLIRSLVTLVFATAAWTALVLVLGKQPLAAALNRGPLGLFPAQALASAPQVSSYSAMQPACPSDRSTDCVPQTSATSKCPDNNAAGCQGTRGIFSVGTDDDSVGRKVLPVATDEMFVVDSGPWLDVYTSGDASGLMTVTLPVTRVFSIWMTPTLSPPLLDANGFLNTGVSLTQLISEAVLPATATLKLAVYDVDDKAGQLCNEVDKVALNGFAVVSNTTGAPGQLNGENNQWSMFESTVPITYLKFATDPGLGNTPTPATQVITIDVSVGCRGTWALTVDWAAIQIDSPVLPVELIHGYTGGLIDLKTFQDYLGKSDGIPQDNRNYEGIINLTNTASLLANAVGELAAQYGTKRVDIIAHSAGGIAARQMLGTITTTATQVRNLLTFGTPHVGWDWASYFGDGIGRAIYDPIFTHNYVAGRCYALYPNQPNQLPDCLATAETLTVKGMCELNYKDCKNSLGIAHDYDYFPAPYYVLTANQPNPAVGKVNGVQYRSFIGSGKILGVIASDVGEGGTYPWNTDQKPYPMTTNVDIQFRHFGGTFTIQHEAIIQEREALDCAMSLIAPRGYTCPPGNNINNGSMSQMGINGNEPLDSEQIGAGTEDAAWPTYSDQIVASAGVSLSNGLPFTSTASVAGSRSLFMVTSDQPVSVTLRTPDGSTIDPDVALSTPGMNYAAWDGNFLSLDGYTVQYRVDDPQAGEWQTVVTAYEPSLVSVYTTVSDTVGLGSRFDQDTYAPGDPVRLEALFADASGVVPGFFISGMINATDGVTTPLAFVDDGTGGDTTAGDGIYTAQFNAPDATGRDPYFPVGLYGVTTDTTRYAMATLLVRPQTARLTASIAEGTRDTAGRGLFDALVLTPTVYVSQTGRYRLSGDLVDAEGVVIATALTQYGYDDAPLAVGEQPMPLVFDGPAIRMHGVDGPYRLTGVALSDENNVPVVVELAQDVYTTTAYAATAFVNPPLGVTGGGELALDTDGNGLFDSLQITLTLNAVNPGGYSWSASLNDDTGRQIGYYYSSGELTRTSPITLVVPGYAISMNGRDGPYMLRNLSVAQTSGEGSEGNGVLIDHAYTTDVYTATQFEPLRPFTGTLTTAGPSVPVTISVPGQEALLTFDGTAGQLLSLGLEAASTSYVSVTLDQPDGTRWLDDSTSFNQRMDIDLSALPANGLYTVTFSPRYSGTGVYTLTLSAAQTGTLVVDGATVTYTVARLGQDVRLTFEASAGQLVNVGVGGASGSASAGVTLLRPDGSTLSTFTVSAGGQADIDTAALTAGGTYTLRVNPTASSVNGTGTYSVTASTPLVSGLAVDGSSQVVTVTRLGQDARLPFDGTAGQLLDLGVDGAGARAADVYVLKPDGSQLTKVTLSANGKLNYDTAPLATSGTYTVLIDPQNNATSTYTVTLSTPVTDTLSINGGPKAVTITRLAQDARLTFDANAGQSLTLTVAAPSGKNAYMYVYAPNGSTLKSCNNCSTTNLVLGTLAASGTYTARVDPTSGATGTYTLTLTMPGGGYAPRRERLGLGAGERTGRKVQARLAIHTALMGLTARPAWREGPMRPQSVTRLRPAEGLPANRYRVIKY